MQSLRKGRQITSNGRLLVKLTKQSASPVVDQLDISEHDVCDLFRGVVRLDVNATFRRGPIRAVITSNQSQKSKCDRRFLECL